ncbi:hypothetical protein [Tropicimonas marinistellae]|uniref:hypothetical protein n=1 Tax=Tropicimonas marinistellae TaxID=1739787 RepID=UPI00082EC057|nr:hypothetical protein [Tropicimonas marinistellae]
MPPFELETYDLGSSVLIRSRISGATVISNAVGLDILTGLRCGETEASLAARLSKDGELNAVDALSLVRATLDDWDSAGLFLAEAFEDPATDVKRPNPAEMLSRTFALDGRTCTVRSPFRILLDQVSAVLAPYEVASSDVSGCTIEAVGGWDDFVVISDGDVHRSGLDHDQLRHLVLREVIASLAGRSATAALLHASCVAQAGVCMVIAGPSGSGKTTLALELAMAGWDHVGDDLIPLLRDGCGVCAVPAAASVKLDRSAEPALRAPQSVSDLGAALGLDYCVPSTAVAAGSKLRVGAILFPTYSPDAVAAAERIAPEHALIGLLGSGSDLVRISDSIEPLASLCNSVPAFRITYGGSSTALRLCADVFEVAGREHG